MVAADEVSKATGDEVSERYEVFAGRAELRLTGDISLRDAVARVTAAIAQARSQGVTRLLVLASDVAPEVPEPGQSPSATTERFRAVTQWAAAAGGTVRVALVMRPECIDPEEFGETVASNRGMDYEVFDSEREAREWLTAPRRKT